MANLANTYKNQEHWCKTEELAVQVMETRKRDLGNQHHSTLNSFSNRAVTFMKQGRLNEAAEC
jgi:hypothetical protein